MPATRVPLLSALLLALLFFSHGRAAEDNAPVAKTDAFVLMSVEGEPGASKFNDAQLAYVQSWIKQKAPECPPAASAAVAEQFLVELQQRDPTKFAQLLVTEIPSGVFEPMLLRQVATKLTGTSQATAREELARRRVGAVLVAAGQEPQVALKEASGLIAKIKEASSAQHRRLLEGKMDEDELDLQLRKIKQPSVVRETAPAKPKVLTAAEVVAEFARRNQSGASLQRLHAYVVEGRLTNAAGEEQELLLFKMRPDRFRLVIRAGGLTRYIMAADGNHFWQQTTGQLPQMIPAEKMGSRLYLAEFVDPLFAGEGFVFERQADGERDGKSFYRIAVRRPDGSHFVACIDPETMREISRENEDKSVAYYSDFREVGGVTFAFREEVTEAGGHKAAFVITRIAPNPGLIQNIFELPAQQNRGYFEMERLLAAAPAVNGASRP